MGSSAGSMPPTASSISRPAFPGSRSASAPLPEGAPEPSSLSLRQREGPNAKRWGVRGKPLDDFPLTLPLLRSPSLSRRERALPSLFLDLGRRSRHLSRVQIGG